MRKTLLACAIAMICSLAAMAFPPSGHDAGATSELKLLKSRVQDQKTQANLTRVQDLTRQEVKDIRKSKGLYVTDSYDDFTTETGKTASSKAPMREDEKTYKLTVNLKYDKDEVWGFDGTAYPNYASDFWISNEEPEDETPEALIFQLPAGSYDLEILLTTQSDDFYLLTTSDVNVDQDKEFSLDVADAAVEIEWEPLLPDGSKPIETYYEYDGNTFEVLREVEGNVLSQTVILNIYNKKHEFGRSIMQSPFKVVVGDVTREGGKSRIKTIPNDDYAFYYKNLSINKDGGYCVPLYADAAVSKAATNDINHYKTITPEYAFTPYQPDPRIFYGEEGEEDVIIPFDKYGSFLLKCMNIRDGKMTGLSEMGEFSSQIVFNQSIHICQDPALSGIFEVMPIPSFREDWDWERNMTGLPVNAVTVTPMVMAINNTGSSKNFLTMPNVWDIYMSEVTNTWLSFDTNVDHVWNYGCPGLVFSTKAMPWGSSFDFCYIGRLGERRSVDLLATQASVAIDNQAPSQDVMESLQWGELPSEGKIDFYFTDTNVEIDGIPGKNTAHVEFDMGRPDWQPPTLQIARFTDTEGNFTDRYSDGNDGVIEFYGGDFTFHYDEDTYAAWYTEEPAAEVRVEYAPYGTESFLPLEVENIAERDFMPGFGTYYRGSLAGVDRKSENGWFDVRITLADAAGNYQEQTLSPAFKIDGMTGVETRSCPDVAVNIIDGVITVCGCGNPEIEIFTADGVLVARASAAVLDVSGLEAAIYLVRVSDGDNRAVRKIRI